MSWNIQTMAMPKAVSPIRVMMKAFLPGGGVLFFRVPEADQGIGAEADPFPSQVEERQVLGQHQSEHGEDEHVQQGEEADIGRFVLAM